MTHENSESQDVTNPGQTPDGSVEETSRNSAEEPSAVYTSEQRADVTATVLEGLLIQAGYAAPVRPE